MTDTADDTNAPAFSGRNDDDDDEDDDDTDDCIEVVDKGVCCCIWTR